MRSGDPKAPCASDPYATSGLLPDDSTSRAEMARAMPTPPAARTSGRNAHAPARTRAKTPARASDLTREDDLLLIAAGGGARPRVRADGADPEGGHARGGDGARGGRVEEEAAAEGRHVRLAQRDVLRDGHLAHEPRDGAIGGNVGE